MGQLKIESLEIKNLQSDVLEKDEKPLADMIHGTASIKFCLYDNGDFDIHDLESIKQEVIRRHCIEEVIEITGLRKQ